MPATTVVQFEESLEKSARELKGRINTMRKPDMMFDQMNNVFPLGEDIAIKNAEALGVSRDDCFDILGR